MDNLELELKFSTNIRIGAKLKQFIEPVRAYVKRNCYQHLADYIYGGHQDKVFILYGLRRTGKTTLIKQLLLSMQEDELNQAAFMQLRQENTLAEVNRDLLLLENNGYKYIFIDEVTLLADFVDGAALFADIFAASGMKIVLSGTDSLGFLFAEDEELYDRCILEHTTYISYQEFERVLGRQGLDTYIRYGGTMSMGGVHYNEAGTFANKKTTDAYIDTAIAKNIQHSLRCYQSEGHFRHLQELYEHHELTSAINRIVEDLNHRFTQEVLTKRFKSNDLALSAHNLRKDRNNPTHILDDIDVAQVVARLKTVLEIREQEEQTVVIKPVHAAEIKEYLQLLDLIYEIPVITLENVNLPLSRTVIAQPGLRYAQADALVKSLLQDDKMKDLPIAERNGVLERVLNEIKGRMLEDIILLATQLVKPKEKVFVLQFPVGEFDMVVFDEEQACCSVYEIKHSSAFAEKQSQHLRNTEKCRQTEYRYGPIQEKCVLYNGASCTWGDIQYKNIREYLNELG